MLIWSAIFLVLACGAALYGYGLPVAGYAGEVQIVAIGCGLIAFMFFLGWVVHAATTHSRAE